MIEQITEFLSGFRRTIKGYDRCLEAIRHRCGLSQTEVTIISFLHNNPSRDTARDIVEVRKIKANLVSVNVDRLAQEGYLERRSVPGDRRKAYLVCTEKAQPIIRRGQEIQAEFQEQLFAGVDAELREKFHRVIASVEDNLDAMLREG